MDTCILYIEDDELQIALTKHTLQRQEYAFHLDFAETGKEGIAAFDPDKHSMVVVDYNLPDMEAPEIAQGLLKKRAPFPIVFMSSAYMESQIEEAEQLGIKACITKSDIKENLKQIAELAIG
ncbi:response regulator [Alteromonadaceae bacterium M269]|nr:response regulator [Alteromonadaceae bacterium M269]